MRGVNKAMILGHLGKDPELRHTQSGKAVASFSIATSEQWKDGSGEKKERTDWHNIVAWGRLGEIAAEYLKKGSQVYVEGKLQTRKWQDKNGNDRYTTEIVIQDLQMLGARNGTSSNYSGDDYPEMNQDPNGKPPANQPAKNELDDDIPF